MKPAAVRSGEAVDDNLRHLLLYMKREARRSMFPFIAVGLLFSAGIAALSRQGETSPFSPKGESAMKPASVGWPSGRAERSRIHRSDPQGVRDQLLFLTLAAHTPDHLMDLLKTHELWDLDGRMTVPPVVFSRYPCKLDRLEAETRKKLFLHALLPTAMVAQAEIEAERKILLDILAKAKGLPENRAFDPQTLIWQAVLTEKEILFLKALTVKYQADKLVELLRRVDTVPVSLIMAQGAVESSWGSSRFAADGNNLFGIWTWGEQGIVPEFRDEDKKHRVAAYDSILASIRGYLLTLNRLPVYEPFREIRVHSRNSLELVDGLTNYSERREEYVAILKDIIRTNNLQQYDKLVLSRDLPVRPSNDVRITDLAPQTGKTIL